MTSSTTTIDAYARRVAAHLRLRGRHRREALTTLREDLLAAAGELGEAEAVAGFGPPAETAARLAEEHAPRERRWAVPVSLDPRGIADRARRTFDPGEPRVFVPRVYGLGWDVNLGAVAVRLGLLRPDDLDDAQFADIRPAEHVRARAGLAAATVATAGLVVVGLRRGAALPAHWGPSGRPDRWARPLPALAPALVTAGTAVALPVTLDAAAAGPRVRVGGTVAGTALATLAAGLAALTVYGGDRRVGPLVAPVAAGALGAGLAAGHASVRPALRRAWATAEGR